MALEHVDQADGLAVGERHDHVGARAEVVEDALRRDGGGHTSRHARKSARMRDLEAS